MSTGMNPASTPVAHVPGTRPSVGEKVVDAVVSDVLDVDIQTMALVLRDPNPIHFDLAAVAAAGMGDRAINQGGSTMAYIIDHLTTWAGSRAALTSIDCQFRGSVAAGDDVAITAVVTAVADVEEPEASGPGERPGAALRVDLDVSAVVIGGGRAIVGTAQVLVAGEAS